MIFSGVDGKKLVKGFLLSLVFIFNFMAAFWVIGWFLNNSGDFLNGNVAASISDDSPSKSSVDSDENPTQNESSPSSPNKEFLNIDARSFISVKIQRSLDSSEKILLSKNEEKKLPIASLTKLMTALVVLERYDLGRKLVISEKAMAQEGEQGMLKAGEILSVENLLYITLIESSNRAAFALSEIIGTDNFISLMNETGPKIGLKNTYFKDSTGLDPDSYSTSGDLVKLTRYLFENYPLFKKIISLKEFDLYLPDGKLHHNLNNTNKILGETQGIVGGKTGWTNFSRGCLMVIQEDFSDPEGKNYLIYVILGAEDRLLEMEKLINWINFNYNIDFMLN